MKQFLKPDWRKILITFPLSIFLYYFVSEYFFGSFGCKSYECFVENGQKECGCWEVNFGPTFLQFIIVLVVLLVISYLFSSFIFWFIDKKTKKRD